MTQTRPFIAVVDDEEPIRKALSRLLSSAGMEVATFESGRAFLTSLSTRVPGCVVLDLNMPDMTGFEVQASLASSGIRVPVVIITGHDSVETHDHAMRSRPVAYLSKPFNDQDLLDAIESALKLLP